jgi:integrase
VIDREDDVLPEQPALDAVKSVAERAFDLFDAGKIGEAGLMAALGVLRKGYVPSKTIAHRAPGADQEDAVEAGRLSEAALTQILGA